MKLAKSLLLGSAAALVATAGATAADLPSKKAAPVQYVKVCDAYGAGFFNIPGTDTCLKVGGRVRADYAYVPAQAIYDTPNALPLTYNKIGAKGVASNLTEFDPSSSAAKAAHSMHTTGWETRGRVDVDARTATAWGTVQTVASLRLARTTGVLASATGAQSASASPTLEAAYVRFSGFTFGAARDNFAFMPSRFYGAGHWGSFANGAKQVAYTAVLGGGFSATLALQDHTDTTLGGRDYTVIAGSTNTYSYGPRSIYERTNMPQVNGRIDFDQAWGSVSLAGAWRQISLVSTSIDSGPYNRYNQKENAWALGLGTKINLPMLAKGDAIWLTAAVADGMSEYTTNWGSFKSSAYRRDTGGAQINAPSYIALGTQNNGSDHNIETQRSWNVAAVMDHYWSPQWRQSFLASYGKVQASAGAKSCASTVDLTNGGGGAASAANSTLANGCFGDVSSWNVGTQVAFLPTRNFEIGIELLYASNSVKMPDAGSGVASSNRYFGTKCLGQNTSVGGAKCTDNNLTGRLRVERTF